MSYRIWTNDEIGAIFEGVCGLALAGGLYDETTHAVVRALCRALGVDAALPQAREVVTFAGIATPEPALWPVGGNGRCKG